MLNNSKNLRKKQHFLKRTPYYETTKDSDSGQVSIASNPGQVKEKIFKRLLLKMGK